MRQFTEPSNARTSSRQPPPFPLVARTSDQESALDVGLWTLDVALCPLSSVLCPPSCSLPQRRLVLPFRPAERKANASSDWRSTCAIISSAPIPAPLHMQTWTRRASPSQGLLGMNPANSFSPKCP